MIHIDKSLKRTLCGLIPVFIALSGLPDVTSAVCAAGEEEFYGEAISGDEYDTAPDAVGSQVSYEVQGGNIYFDTGTGTVTNSDRNITEAIIPEKINDVTVTAIGSNAFQYRDDLERVSLPGTVTKIGDYAFRFDECLSGFTLGGSRFDPFDENNGVDVGYLAFTDCLFVRPDFSDSYKKGNYYRLLHSSATRDYLKGKEHYLSDITVIAKSQLGYHEGNSLNDMDGTSYGYGDYSEYTYFWGEPGMMWCGEFVAWCIAMASVPREIFTSKYHTPDERTFTWNQTSYAGSGGNYRLKQGDVLHFDYEGGNHVCLVYGSSYSAEDGIVTIDTLDGNHNNDVSREKYRIEAATGSVLNSWPDRNPVIKYIFSPDTSVVSDLTYYRVDFDVNGGDPLVKDGEEPNWTMDPRYKELTYRAFYGLMPLPTRAGYEFAGWYTGQNEGDEGDRKITSYMLFREHSDQTLYARWVKPDKGGEPEAGKGTGTYSDEREVSEAGYEGWKLDHPTGTVTKIPDTWEGGEIPETLDGVAIRKIGKSASSGNDRVTEIVFPEGLEAIDSYAFSRCSALQKVTFPSTLLMIGEQCFYYCTDLEIVNCAGDMDLIRKGRYAFNRTPWLHGDMSPEFKRGPWYRDLQSVPSLSDPDYDPLQNVIDIGTALAGYHEGDDRSELTGINANGNGEYAEPVFFAGSPDYLWLKNVPYVSYGGWCGQYCSYILRMAGLPPAASGMINNNDEDEMTWEDLTVAGGSHELTRGDVLHMRIGHYCIVTNVEEKGDRVYVTTLNGNHGNGVCFDTYKLYKTNGCQKSGGTKSNYDVTDIYRYNPDWKTSPGIKSYKLLFDVNGGNELPSKYKTVYEGAYYGLLPDPHRDGYVFEGWFTAPGDGNGKKITPYRLVAGSENDVTLYAHWRQNSTSVTGVTVTKDNEIVEIGKSKYLEAEVMPVTAVDRKLVWKSTDTAVATVDNNGKVEGVDTGETYIIAISEDGGFMGKCLVTVTDGSVRFDLTDGGYLMFNEETGTITGSGVIGESLVIPSLINGVSVTAIGKGAFSGQDSLKHVTIPDTVRMIGSEAFEGTSLEDLSLPDSVKQISSYAFYGIQSLETVYIPNSVRYIYYAAFLNCTSLQKVTFQGSRENLKYLADNAFPEDPEGTLIVWGTEDYEGEDDWSGYSSGGSDKHEIGTKEKDYDIDDRGYIKGVYNITNAQIPSEIGGKTVKGISEWGFGNRVYLKSIAFPPTVKEIEDYAFFNCPCLETVFIPDSVEVIGKNCFGFNKNSLTSASSATAGSLSKVTIGSGVKTIKGYVFQNQTALEEIEIHAKKSEVTIDRNAFPAGVKVIFTEDQEPVTVSVNGVTLPAAGSVKVGKTITLTPVISPADATDRTVTWKSSAPGVATVSANGLVTGIKEGTADITVTTHDGGFTATCRVTVEPASPGPGPGPAPGPDPSEEDLEKDIDPDPEELDLHMLPGEVRRLKINRTGKYVYGVSYVSQDTRTVSVKNGVVTAKNLKKGETEKTVKVTATYNGESADFTITVRAGTPDITPGEKGSKITAPKTVKADVETSKTKTKTVTAAVKLPKALQGKKVKAKVVLPEDLPGTSVADGDTENDIFYLSEGTPDAKGTKVSFVITPREEAGAAYIVWTVTDDSRKEPQAYTQAYTKVLIKNPLSTLSVNCPEDVIELGVGGGERLTVITEKGNTDSKDLSFSVKMKKGKGIRVSKSGFVTAASPDAEAEVTVKSGKVKKTVTVKVDPYSGSVLALSKTSVSAKRPKTGGKPKTVSLKISAPKKNPPAVNWSITGPPEDKDPEGITVKDGKVTVTDGASPGCYTVTAAPGESSGYNPACCEVIVR